MASSSSSSKNSAEAAKESGYLSDISMDGQDEMASLTSAVKKLSLTEREGRSIFDMHLREKCEVEPALCFGDATAPIVDEALLLEILREEYGKGNLTYKNKQKRTVSTQTDTGAETTQRSNSRAPDSILEEQDGV